MVCGAIWRVPLKIADWNRSLREPAFATSLAPVTLTLTRWPSIRTRPVFSRAVWIWTSYLSYLRKLSSSDRQTDRQDRHYIPRRFAGGQIYSAYVVFVQLTARALRGVAVTSYVLRQALLTPHGVPRRRCRPPVSDVRVWPAIVWCLTDTRAESIAVSFQSPFVNVN